MSKTDTDFLKRLLATFKVEAREHLSTISSGLFALKKASAAAERTEIVETIFRETHTLKGAARTVNMEEIETISRALENVFSTVKRQDSALSSALFDRLHRAVDMLDSLLASDHTAQPPPDKPQISQVIHELETALHGAPPPRMEDRSEPQGSAALGTPQTATEQAEQTKSEKPLPPAETLRIPAAKLDSLFLQVEELLSAKLAASQRVAELQEIKATLNEWKREWAKVRSTVTATQSLWEKADRKQKGVSPRSAQENVPVQMRPLFAFLAWNNGRVKGLDSKLTMLTQAVEQDCRALGAMVDSLLEDMKKALMAPFQVLLEAFPKLVHDLSRDQGKEVELIIHNRDIEADRRILEEMRSPLMHLVRNCLDHGIEAPEERARKRKIPCGTITIAITEKNSKKVEIVVTDDGAGINVAKVRGAAVKLGILSQEEATTLDEQKTLSLIFRSGVTTSPMVTDISGRGLGLAIVREKVEKLGGLVSAEIRPNGGTTFRLMLPLTIVAFRGVLLRVADRLFLLPTTYVEHVYREKKETIKTVENRDTIRLDGQTLALVRLGDVLELPRTNAGADAASDVSVVVLGAAEKRIAFLVDEVINEQEVLVKNLGKQLARVRNIAGATVLGMGQVVPILNVPDLLKSAVQLSKVAGRPSAVSAGKAEATRKAVLVVEDSITARTLLKNILEMAGYEVATAVDGVDGFTQLRGHAFDLVVSDVTMPRMNGFDLTATIRGDKKLAAVPVVLVTGLESREDRERGIEVGANAYIVKSSFDQSNLLKVIHQLI